MQNPSQILPFELEGTLFNFEGSRAFKTNGGVAQLGEHLPCTQGVRSSNLLISTKWEKQRMKELQTCERDGLIAQQVRAHA